MRTFVFVSLFLSASRCCLNRHLRFVVYMAEFLFDGRQFFRLGHQVNGCHDQSFDKIQTVVYTVFRPCGCYHLRCVRAAHRVRVFTDLKNDLDRRGLIADIPQI